MSLDGEAGGCRSRWAAVYSTLAPCGPFTNPCGFGLRHGRQGRRAKWSRDSFSTTLASVRECNRDASFHRDAETATAAHAAAHQTRTNTAAPAAWRCKMPKKNNHKGQKGFVFEITAKCEAMVQADRCAAAIAALCTHLLVRVRLQFLVSQRPHRACLECSALGALFVSF